MKKTMLLVALASLLALPPAHAQDKPKEAKEKDPRAATEIPTGVEYPIKVQVSVWVNSITRIDEVDGTFAAEVDVRLRWNDARLAFDQKALGLDRLEYGFEEAPAKLAAMWTPQITIGNMEKNPTQDQTGLIIHARGAAEVLRRTNAKFKSALDFSRFPFDTQKLTIELRSPRYGTSQIVFAQEAEDRNQSGVKAGTAIPNWFFDRALRCKLDVRRGWTGRDHAIATLEIKAHRETSQYFFQLFLPFFTIMLFPPLALWVPKAEVMPRANMAFSGLFSLIALSYSIFVRYPMLAAVDNVIVRMLWLGYLFLAFVLLLIMTVHNPNFTSQFGGKHVWAEAASWTTWSVPILFALAIGSTILFSM
jgi:hypothetical protein